MMVAPHPLNGSDGIPVLGLTSSCLMGREKEGTRVSSCGRGEPVELTHPHDVFLYPSHATRNPFRMTSLLP